MSDRRIVYIRATDLRPLYVKSKGKYYLIEACLSPDRMTAYFGYFLRVSDHVRVKYKNESDGRIYLLHVEVDLDTEFTDDPRIGLKNPNYVFA
jgi:hypothetical protein